MRGGSFTASLPKKLLLIFLAKSVGVGKDDPNEILSIFKTVNCKRFVVLYRAIPINYQISYDAEKEFVDAQGVTQNVKIPKVTILVSHNTLEYTVKDLSPFTTYHVTVTAKPEGRGHTPPAKITVTTQMAAPQPMVKPDFFGVKKDTPGVITVYLPQASEEYGPISHYYLVVIPYANSTQTKHPDYYDSANLISYSKSPPLVGNNKNVEPEAQPYITAKFLQRSLPYTFPLGDNRSYEGFLNRPLKKNVVYKIFVRAYVDVPQKHLYTSSPFSPVLSLDMPYGKQELRGGGRDFLGIIHTLQFGLLFN